ncbi:ABC transporter permease [Halobacterium bonnevillei]|uniref:ABC transporter permease subunit n=1 Tax=Halobacterium bonnevillei TaxID=2692200 RepID=A0A6B0SML2_9EURY|nr:ABC transporter permease [Halobacterium bonnevillei]MXR20120.1 ABC transporter permease subunit [Halobacterium bonnevillei]
MSRWSYFAKRLVLSIPVILFGTTITFFVIYAGPIDPAYAILGSQATPDKVADIHRQLGMNQPMWEMYFDYIVDMFTFNLGNSWVIRPDLTAYEVIMDFAPRTVLMGAWAVILPLFVGIPLGFYAGLNPNTLGDYTASFGGIIWRAMPNFWLAVLLLLVLSRSEEFLFGFSWESFIYSTPVAGAPDMENIWNFENFLRASKVVIPGAMVLGSASMGNEMRIGRTAFLEARNSNYVEMARAKGLPGRSIVWKHIFRNALIPLVPVITAEAGVLVGGSVLVETVFGINGIGWLFFTAMTSGDLPLAAALMFLFILLLVGLNILQDFLYTIIDPRVGFESN